MEVPLDELGQTQRTASALSSAMAVWLFVLQAVKALGSEGGQGRHSFRLFNEYTLQAQPLRSCTTGSPI